MANRMKALSLEEIDKQEHLSSSVLKKLVSVVSDGRPADAAAAPPQPKSGLVALINWTHDNFSWALKKTNHLKLINNRIVIDGQFLHYCSSKKITVECLHNDPVISWRSEFGSEKFIAQGVFRINTKGFSFLHAALFNNGNSEEEVFHFVIVNELDLQKYLKLRNDFDGWAKERDALQEKVGGGSGKKIAGLDRYTTKIKK